MSDAAPNTATVAPTAVPTTPPVTVPPVVEEPQGSATTPPAAKRGSRLAQVREVVAKRIAAAAPKDASTQTAQIANEDTEKPAAAAPPDKQEPSKEPEAGKAKAWADVMERENRARMEREQAKREREQIARERAAFETERAASKEAAELLAKDPVAYAAKFGGKDFGKKLVDYSLDEKTRIADQQSAKLAEIDAKIEHLGRMQQEKDVQSKISEYIATHRTHWKTDKDSAVLGAWYDESEIDSVVQSIAERHVAATKEILTPMQLASNLRGELRSRLERLAKTEVGQEFLKQFITGTTPPPAKSRPPAEAPKTLSKDLTTQGMPPGDGRLRKLTDKDRSDMIRQVLSRRQG